MSIEFKFAGPAVAIIYLIIEPGGKMRTLERPKTASQLLAALNLEEETALVIREGALLTPDRRIWPGQSIRVRLTGSRG